MERCSHTVKRGARMGQCTREATEAQWCHQHSPVRQVEKFRAQIWREGERLKDIMTRVGRVQPGSTQHVMLVSAMRDLDATIDLMYAACREIWPDFPERGKHA